MPETNILETLINTSGGTNHSLEKLALYLSSNKTYKYTPTYLTDSSKDYDSFKKHIDVFKTEIIAMFSVYEHSLMRLRISLLKCWTKIEDTNEIKLKLKNLEFSYTLKLNNAVSIDAETPDLVEINSTNEQNLLNLLNQGNLYKHYLTLEFRYNIPELFNLFNFSTNPNTSGRKTTFKYKVEHTYFIEKKGDHQIAIDSFINLLKLDLCAKVSSFNK